MNVWLAGHAGCYNHGCEAIVRSTARLLDERFGPCCYTVLSNSPASDAEQFDSARFRVLDRNKGVSRFDWRWIGSKLRRFPGGRAGHAFLRRLPGWPTCALSIGGDNFTMDYGSPKSFMVEVRRLRAAGIPVAIWGASIGPFTADPKLEARMIEFLGQVDLITVRETTTIEYLRSLGIERNVRRVWDPAFALEPEPYDGPETALFDLGDVVGMNLSALIARWFPGEDLDAMLGEMAAFVRGLLAEGHRVLLVPHVTDPDGPLCCSCPTSPTRTDPCIPTTKKSSGG
jgi:polysaccharide pyruvyl transferase WcaK-like protein